MRLHLTTFMFLDTLGNCSSGRFYYKRGAPKLQKRLSDASDIPTIWFWEFQKIKIQNLQLWRKTSAEKWSKSSEIWAFQRYQNLNCSMVKNGCLHRTL